VSAGARGTGIARALTADAERELAERGIELAWLHCAIGNDRAARFYEKSGWRRAGVVQSELATPEGPVVIEVWRFEKAVHRPVWRPLHPPPYTSFSAPGRHQPAKRAVPTRRRIQLVNPLSA